MDQEPRTVTLPARWWIAISATTTLMVAIFVVQLAAINHQREIAKRQENRTVEVLEDVRATVRDAQPLADRARPALDDLGAAARDVGPALDGVRALLPDARRLAADADELVRASIPVVEAARASDLGRTLDALRTLSEQLLDHARLAATLDRTAHALDEVRARDLLADADRGAELVPELAAMLRRSVRIQEQTLRNQRRALAVLRRSFAIQAETLRHARSIDRKTGGQLPPAPAPAP